MLHNLLESCIVLLKLLAFFFELLFDILVSNKNSFKIHPFLLNLKPDFNAL